MTWHLELNDPIEAAVAEAMAPDAVITPDGNAFRQGDRDAGPNGTIRSAQTNMIRLGLDGIGEVDGVYGRNTMNGVQDAQEMFGLPRTGVLDQATQDAFNNLTDDQIAFFTDESEVIADEAVNWSSLPSNQLGDELEDLEFTDTNDLLSKVLVLTELLLSKPPSKLRVGAN